MSNRKEDFKRIFGIDLEETPDTLCYELSSQFGNQVLKELKKKNMTISDLARAIGVKPPTVTEWLSPDANLTMKTVAKIALALNCDVLAPQLIGVHEAVISTINTDTAPMQSQWGNRPNNVRQFIPKHKVIVAMEG